MAYALTLKRVVDSLLDDIKQAGTYKVERIISSAQGTQITSNAQEVLNFCANNYLGLSSDPRIIAASKRTLDSHGFGLSSGRFICGTQDIHKQLEQTISAFHATEDSILYSSCYDANAGIFEALLTAEDAVISDALNHASIIDGIRLCKAERHLYRHMDMQHLEECLLNSQSKRVRMIVTDGVFSMDGDFAPLPEICALAEKYNAVIFVDDSHATGFIGRTGRGTAEYFGVQDKIDLINSTLGKAMGGASGGYTTGRREVIELLRQKSRPYLFSNSLAPGIIGATLEAFRIVTESAELPVKLLVNSRHFREGMLKAGFKVIGHPDSPIAPVMLEDARLAAEFANDMLSEGIYVIGFSFPVVPRGLARIRVQLSAAHSLEQVDQAVNAFIEIGRRKGVIN
jgi:glycine C-acetyltransferase